MEAWRYFRACKSHVETGLVITSLWVAPTVSRGTCPMSVVANCCCPLEINTVRWWWWPRNGVPGWKNSRGNLHPVKAGGIQPSVRHFGDRSLRGSLVRRMLPAFKADTESWLSAVACFGFTPPPIPSNQNESALNMGTNHLLGSQYSPLHTHLIACTFLHPTPVSSSAVIQSKFYLWLLNLDQS